MPDSRATALLDVEAEEQTIPREVEPDEPFRILMIADLSGRANRKIREPLKGRRALMIDRDNFDDVFADMFAELRLDGMQLRFRELDDFHPDHIYRNQSEFQEFMEARDKKSDGAARETRSAPPVDLSRGLLDQIVDHQTPEEPVLEPDGDLAAFIKKSIAPHVVHQDPQQKARVARADSAASEAMRAVLHHPEFQALEASWRAVWMLVRGLNTDGDLKLYVFDATLEELVGDLEGTVALLTDPKKAWALLTADFYFGQSTSDARALSLFGRIAQRIQAPFLAGGALDESPSDDWQLLRKAPEARSIGLTLPRFLARMPYGKKTSTVESFEFEEMPAMVHGDYLWANPAFCCAYLLGKTFLKEGWRLRPGLVREIGDLPAHVYEVDGEPEIKPCAEMLMSERQASLLMDQGFMPLASLKGKDAVLLVRFQSIADPVAALLGRWDAGGAAAAVAEHGE